MRTTKRQLRSVEIFTGAGGLAIGTHLAGFEHQALVEREANACNTLEYNIRANSLPRIGHWGGKLHRGDVRGIRFSQFGEVDLVAGGPPCQPFSIGGKHRGLEDTRDMIPQFIRAVREAQPRAFIMENVKGLLRQSFQAYFSYALYRLQYPMLEKREAEGWEQHLARLEDVHTSGHYDGPRYRVVPRLLNAANYGIPQTRERVFLVGFRADTDIEWHFPEASHSLDALLYQQWVSGHYWKRCHTAAPSAASKRWQGRIKRLARGNPPRLKAWRTVREAICDLPDPRGLDHGLANHRYQPGARTYKGHTGSPLDLPAKTLKSGVHGVPGGENMIAFPDGGVRYFTAREAARIQTFPDSWVFEGAWSETMRQLGNAVPASLANLVAASVAAKLVDSP